MPIQVPTFNVPLLNPASLSQSRQADTSIEDAFSESRRLYGERLLARERAALDRQTNAIQNAFVEQRDFTQNVAEGRLTRVPEGGFGFPGAENLARTFSPSPAEKGVSYVRTSELNQVRPFTEFLGSPTREGTTVSMVTDPGTGQFSPQLAAGRTVGNMESALAAIAELEKVLPGQARALREELMKSAEDGFVSLAETDRAIEMSDPQRVIDFQTHYRTMARMNAEDRALFQRNRQASSETYQVLQAQPGGGVRIRDLTAEESIAFGMIFSGNEPGMTDRQKALVEGLRTGERGTLVPRRTTIDIGDELKKSWLDAANSGAESRAHEDFSSWIAQTILDSGGNVINNNAPVVQSIRKVGTPNQAGIQAWAKTQASSPYRMAYALYRAGFDSRNTVETQHDMGQDFPFGIGEAMQAYEELDPTFATVSQRSNGGYISTNAPAVDSDATSFYSDPSWGASRSELTNFLSNTSFSDISTRFIQANTTDDPAELERRYRAAAQGYREVGRESDAAFFEEHADFIASNPEQYMLTRENVILPVMRERARNDN